MSPKLKEILEHLEVKGSANGLNTSFCTPAVPHTGKYLAHINLDWLEATFDQEGLHTEEQRSEFVQMLKQQIDEFVKSDQPSTLLSWSWYDRDGILRKAIELTPVLLTDSDPLFLTEEWYELLRASVAKEMQKENNNS